MAKAVAKEYISIPIDAKTLLLQELKKGDALLFLYSQRVDKYPAYSTFIKTGLENNQLCLYAYETREHAWHPEYLFKEYIDSKQFWLLPLEAENALPQLQSKLKILYNRAKANRVTLKALIDFGRLVNSRNSTDIISFNQKLMKKSKTFPFIGITALDFSSLEQDKIHSVLKLYKKVAIFTPYDVGIALSFSATRKLKEVPLELIPLEYIEQFVKNNLENIVLFLLQEKPLCGYDLIKTISQRYHIFLSQGTVYPLLYSLTERKLLKVEQAAKAKIYLPTEKSNKLIKTKLDGFRKAHEHMLSLFRKIAK